MKFIISLLVVLLALNGVYSCKSDKLDPLVEDPKEEPSKFKATGNLDPERRGKPFQVGEVVVNFDGPISDVYMSFNLPAIAAVMVSKNIGYFNGYAETYDVGRKPERRTHCSALARGIM